MAELPYFGRSSRTLSDALKSNTSLNFSKTAFVHLDTQGREAERLSYGELDARVDAVAADIVGAGLAGKRLLLLFPPCLDFVVALFACFRAGAIAVPLPNTAGRRTADRVSAIARDAQPAAALTVRRESAAEALGLRCLYVDETSANGDAVDPAMVSPDRVALLQYTSGSTSRPKGVMLSHANLLANNAMIADAFGHDAELRGVGWLPLFHDMGLIGHVLQPVFVGGTSVLMSPLAFLQRPRRWLEAISTWRATTSGGPSHGYALCLRHIQQAAANEFDLSSWRVAYCGSEPINAATLGQFADRFAPAGFDAKAFLPCYGLAEASLLATSRAMGSGIATNGEGRVSCGRAWGAATVSVADPETGAPVAPGQPGEICIAGPHITAGYWNDEAATAALFRTVDGVRQLRTGDIGTLDDGGLHVHGRLKDIVIVMGSNHAAEDIEAVVTASDGLFHQQGCAAFASQSGERERAVVVQEVAARGVADEALTAAAAAASAGVIGALGLRIDDLLIVRAGTLPRTSSGKVQRARTRELYEANDLLRLNGGLAA